MSALIAPGHADMMRYLAVIRASTGGDVWLALLRPDTNTCTFQRKRRNCMGGEAALGFPVNPLRGAKGGLIDSRRPLQ